MKENKCWLKQAIENKKKRDLIKKEANKEINNELAELGKNWNKLSNRKLTRLN